MTSINQSVEVKNKILTVKNFGRFIEALSGPFVIVFILTLFVGITFGWFAKSVEIVQKELNKDVTINQKLKEAKIQKISRGFHGLSGSVNYLFVKLQDGSSFELDTGTWMVPGAKWTQRGYIIKVDKKIEYFGSKPLINEPKDNFMHVILSDIDYAEREAIKRKQEEMEAIQSWK